MSKGSRLSIVLPCFNEASAVEPVLLRLLDASESMSHAGVELQEVIFVDDGSTDGTAAVVSDWIQRVRSSFLIRIVQHPKRMGYGAALKTGFTAAEGELLAFYDVDGTYDPLQIPDLVHALKDSSALMACGDRLSECKNMPLTRELGNRLFVATINLLFGTKVLDSCTGMRVLRRGCIDASEFSQFPDGLDFSLALTLSFLSSGRLLTEVPIPYAKRIGRSKLRILLDGPKFYFRIMDSWIQKLKASNKAEESRKVGQIEMPPG